MKEIIEKDFKNFFTGTGRKKEYIGDLTTIIARNLKNCYLYITRSGFKFGNVSDPDYGIIRTSFRTSYYGDYKIHIGNERGYDTLMMLGLNREKEIIEKVFAIPYDVLDGKTSITIMKTGQKYQKFRIDEKPYNKVCQYLKIGNYSMLDNSNITII